MGGNGKHRWKISFHRSSTHPSRNSQPPKEFICPITASLMSDPVVVTSGQTFERLAVEISTELKFSPILDDGTRPDFSTIIPNLAIKTTITNWCDKSRTQYPPTPDYTTVEKLIKEAMAAAAAEKEEPIRVSEKELLNAVADNPPVIFSHAATELGPRVNRFNSGSSSEESVIIGESPGTPLPFTLRPTCFSPSSSSSFEIEVQNPNVSSPSEEEETLLKKLKSNEVFEQEQGVITLRSITRNREEARASLCTSRILAILRSLIPSRYVVVQVNAIASLVNLSLQKSNKMRIVRSGFVPLLIDVLKGGSSESQEHAAGALFSLALDDDNKMAIGVLGALQPLMHALRSDSERTRHDSALALYHLTLVQSNRFKLVKLGVVPTLLSMLMTGTMASRVLLILCNLAMSVEGRTAMLDANAVECMVNLLRGNELDSEATRENCVAALYALSHGSLRFKGLAKEAKAVEVLRVIEETGTERAREKAKRVLQKMRGFEDGDDEDDSGFDSLFESSGLTRTRYRGAGARNNNLVNSTTF
ncbi:U-box domain-containing protein 38-like [Trifolium pratense]|uniref:Uncharacterized protein n=2 Tax=Trifolium pratense TaxID=57577 RepID=A0ACB0K3M0_TRIPR|nr:U-box domain-containing protein 38 [Trifolium pratense]PNY13914.1 U-box domain-containing protein 38-like [Trifolium pratense]CAJ2651919.1 unnamed protein product [Trifolium pratense]